MTGRDDTYWLRLRRRFLTSAGNIVGQTVTTGAGSVAVTFPRAEVDAAFGVCATPSWGTTVWVTAKSTTGCTVNFGTVAPAGGTVDLITFRSE